MTQQEFTERTMVEVSVEEYSAIETVYMNSDLDKDEFCKMWRKMNKTRVENAKNERTKKAKDEAYRDALHKFYHKTSSQDQWVAICYVRISVKEAQAMSYANIKFANEYGSGLKCLFDIRHEIGKYLGIY